MTSGADWQSEENLLGRKTLEAVACIVTPDTILAWHRRLVAMKWTFPRKKVGRPMVMKDVRELIVEMARTTTRWGYTSIQNRLCNLGHRVSRTTVAKVLREHGLEPAPTRSRGTSWNAFLKAQWAGMAAIDAGITPHPTGPWMLQIARNLTDAFTGFLVGKRYLIMDRDSNFHTEFRQLLDSAGIRPVRTPPSAPNCNAYLERFHGSLKEATDRVILFGEAHLRRVVDEYLVHYDRERNHQGLDGKIIDPGGEVGLTAGTICRRARLGGMLNYYYREAA